MEQYHSEPASEAGVVLAISELARMVLFVAEVTKDVPELKVVEDLGLPFVGMGLLERKQA